MIFIVFYNIRHNHLYSGFTQHEKTVSFLYCTGEYMHNDGQTRYEVSTSLRKGSKNKCVRHVAYIALQSNNTREARSITYSTSSSSTHENSTHTDTTEATPLGRLRSPWIPPFDPPFEPHPRSFPPTPTLRRFCFFRAYRERFAYAPVNVELNGRQSKPKETWTQRHVSCDVCC